LYATDAIVFPPNGEMVKGREAITAFWKGFIDGNMTAQIETVETETQGNLGVEVGKYTIMDGTGKTVDQGKYVVTWKKAADGWKLYRDIWNTNMPAPAPETK
jgi:ketosteroid isomerase-like protein